MDQVEQAAQVCPLVEPRGGTASFDDPTGDVTGGKDARADITKVGINYDNKVTLLGTKIEPKGPIRPGDRVKVEVSPYDLNRARIVYRHR